MSTHEPTIESQPTIFYGGSFFATPPVVEEQNTVLDNIHALDVDVLLLFLLFIIKLFKNDSPSAKAAFQGAVYLN